MNWQSIAYRFFMINVNTVSCYQYMASKMALRDQSQKSHLGHNNTEEPLDVGICWNSPIKSDPNMQKPLLLIFILQHNAYIIPCLGRSTHMNQLKHPEF